VERVQEICLGSRRSETADQTYHDWYVEPLLMTPVDALDTMILMGLKDEGTRRANTATHLHSTRTSTSRISRSQIRLLGGLLSSYQMIGDSGC
jgi:hypothetical protein